MSPKRHTALPVFLSNVEAACVSGMSRGTLRKIAQGSAHFRITTPHGHPVLPLRSPGQKSWRWPADDFIAAVGVTEQQALDLLNHPDRNK